jgi:hypothetical protein
VPADVSEPHVAAIRARKIVLSPRKPIAALAHRLRATQSPPTNAEVRMRMGPLGAGLLRAMHDLASAVLMRNRRTSEAPHGAVTPLPGTSRCAETASKVVITLHNICYRRLIHGSSRIWWNSRPPDSAVVLRFAAGVLGRRVREAGVVDAGQFGELSFSERYARSTGLWNGCWSRAWALYRRWISQGCGRPRRAGGDGRAELPLCEPGTFLRAHRRRHRVKSVC